MFSVRKAKQLKAMEAPAFWRLTASAELTAESRVWAGKPDNSWTCGKQDKMLQVYKLLHKQPLERPCGRNGADGEHWCWGSRITL